MSLFYGGIAASSIATIFLIWRAYQDFTARRVLGMRERIAYMVWMAAQEAP